MSRALPILFNTDMVRAILDGRKTVTRRVVNPQLIGHFEVNDQPLYIYDTDFNQGRICSPYQPGDILYVRETVWQKIGHYLDVDGETKGYYYNEFLYVASDKKPETGWNYSWVKRPSIHMPKEAARIWLKATDVRVERLQEITEEQAQAEGCNSGMLTGPCSARWQFEELWNSTLKKSDLDRYGWDANPWVWVIEFERCEKPRSEYEIRETRR